MITEKERIIVIKRLLGKRCFGFYMDTACSICCDCNIKKEWLKEYDRLLQINKDKHIFNKGKT